MFNQETGFKISVIVPPGGFPVLEVPPQQVGDVDRLLNDHGIGHTVASRLIRGEPSDPITIHIGKLWNEQQVQDVLDSVQ